MKTLALRATIIVAIGIVALALWQMHEAALLLGIALVLSAGLGPLVDRVSARGVPRPAAAAIIFGVLLLFLVGSLVALGTLAAADLARLAESLPNWYGRLRRAMIFSGGWLGQVGAALPYDALSTDQLADPATTRDALVGAITGVGLVATLIISVASLGFYWIADQQRIEQLWISLLPLGSRARTRTIWREVYHEIGVYVRGEAAIVTLTTAALLILLSALDVPGATILAVAGGLAQVVPILGPPLAVLPGAVVALAQGQLSAALALAGSVAALLAIRLIVAPRVFREGISPNPVLVIVLILALFQAGGVVLMLLAPPLATAIQTITRILSDEQRARAVAPRADQIGALRDRLDSIAAAITTDHPDTRRLQDMIDRARRLVDQAERTTT
jgi:predicted PurR-regulated permease PerM